MEPKAISKSGRLQIRVGILHHRDHLALILAGSNHGVCKGDYVWWGLELGRVRVVEKSGSIAHFLELPDTGEEQCLIDVGECRQCGIRYPGAKPRSDPLCCAGCGWIPGTKKEKAL